MNRKTMTGVLIQLIKTNRVASGLMKPFEMIIKMTLCLLFEQLPCLTGKPFGLEITDFQIGWVTFPRV